MDFTNPVARARSATRRRQVLDIFGHILADSPAYAFVTMAMQFSWNGDPTVTYGGAMVMELLDFNYFVFDELSGKFGLHLILSLAEPSTLRSV